MSNLIWIPILLSGALEAPPAASPPLATPPAEIAPSTEIPAVGPVPEALRRERKLDPFYQKYLALAGFPILGSDKVTDHALREAAWILRHVLAGRSDILRAMADRGVHLVVMAYDEYTTDVPEQRDMQPRVYWDRRARGLGGSPVSGAEENLLGYPNDPYSTENILIHEFAHAIQEFGLPSVDPTFDARLRKAFEAATGRGLWKGTYAGGNRHEYWAEGVQSWFDDNRQNDALHNHVNTRVELEEYDPDLARLCADVFGKNAWRYHRPAERDAADLGHLAGFDRSKAPRFHWREEPISAAPRVLIQTDLGDLELELDATHAPVTVKNFLHLVHEGFYADGFFARTVTAANQEADPVKIAVVQANANPVREKEFSPPIPLERTRDTGLRHVDATVSMARAEPDTACDHFFICIGDQPALDFGGARNPDGQGFAAFGKVVKGMDVVRKIHASPAEGQKLTPAIRIQRAVRLE
jgi:cyclophilin family peptidyl-prolyl cis-trans isomerase